MKNEFTLSSDWGEWIVPSKIFKINGDVLYEVWDNFNYRKIRDFFDEVKKVAEFYNVVIVTGEQQSNIKKEYDKYEDWED